MSTRAIILTALAVVSIIIALIGSRVNKPRITQIDRTIRKGKDGDA
jgi:hypothetical protein